MTNIRSVLAAFALAAFAHPLPAAGQTVVASGVVSAASINSLTEMSAAAAIGFHVNRFASVGVEITSVPDVGIDGRAAMFTTNVRVDIPAIGPRFVPYVIAGGGVAHVRDTQAVAASEPVPGIPVVIPPRSVTESSTALALTSGGGASVLVGPHISIDLDLRYMRLIAARDRNVGRFGAGFSYRF
jgi:opacity protein-like surface antigen